MAGKGAPFGNKYASKGDTGRTISLYLTADDMTLLRLVLGKNASDEQCVKLAKQAAKAGINRLLLPKKDEEVKDILGIRDSL